MSEVRNERSDLCYQVWGALDDDRILQTMLEVIFQEIEHIHGEDDLELQFSIIKKGSRATWVETIDFDLPGEHDGEGR